VVQPQEQLGLQIPREYLNRYISLIKTHVPLVPAELIFNIDETSPSDWEERRAKLVIVPSHASQTAPHYSVDRAIRHQTLLCCVLASGDAYCPLFIATRPKATKIFEKSVRENIDLKLEIRQTLYRDSELFTRYIREAFLPTVAANRELPGCANKPALLFCDNCATQCSDEILRELARNGVLLLTYPPHTSHIFQVLDVLPFGRLKVLKEYFPKDDHEDREIDQSSEYSERMRS
jgi:hypothetical protein